MREALRLSSKDLGTCFCGSPLRCVYLLALCLCCQVDLAHHSLAQLRRVFIPGTVLWPERQDLAGKQQPHSDHTAVESPSPKKGRCCFQEDSGGIGCCSPRNACSHWWIKESLSKTWAYLPTWESGWKLGRNSGLEPRSQGWIPALPSSYRVTLAALVNFWV